MASKQELIDQLKAKGIEADESMHPQTLTKMLRDTEAGSDAGTDADDMPAVASQPQQVVQEQAPQGYMRMEDVKALIAQALADQKEDAGKPVKIKRITEYTARLFRIDGKWVVDFKDQNTDADGNKKDEYIKNKLHAWQKFNEQTREFEAWIEVVLEDKTTKVLSLKNYINNRVPVVCTILKRHQADKSYSIGEVEKKKEVGDKYVGTGVMVDQEVVKFEETFDMKTPDGQVLTLPHWVIN